MGIGVSLEHRRVRDHLILPSQYVLLILVELTVDGHRNRVNDEQ